MDFGVEGVEITGPPTGFEKKFYEIFTPDSVQFLSDLVNTFQFRVCKILRERKLRKLTLNETGTLPTFQKTHYPEKDWKISPVPSRLIKRHLDLGDVSPANADHLKKALQSKVQGIQVDYDDGHCPTWGNMIEGIHNVVSFSQGRFFPGEIPSIESAPLLLLRPRAWCMNEHNILISGKEIPGPLMDFGLLIFHTGLKFSQMGIGPFYYLSKLEGSLEARLWNDIFTWTQARLGIPHGSIKACVLIENILAAFQMEDILYELREHSLGLNCGIWDYAASIVNKFGERHEFILPDRNKYVNMDKHFLNSYMKLVVQTCHRRGAHATGGMAAVKMSETISPDAKMQIVEKVCKSKLREIHAGVDGFLVYDTELVNWMNELWNRFGSDFGPNQINSIGHQSLQITPKDLLEIPSGGVTFNGLKQNIKVGVLFIYSWIIEGKGHFILDGAVEDSATAEISRSQVWQWIYHHAELEDQSKERVTKSLVNSLTWEFYRQNANGQGLDRNALKKCCKLFLEIVTSFEFPEFITTLLYNHSLFRNRK